MKKITALAFLVLGIVSFGFSHQANAVKEYSIDFYSPETVFLPNILHSHLNRQHFMDRKEDPPADPHFKQVKFLKQPPPKTLSERVDRLIHGIYIDIPPKYDHYGYEIRRNMKSILAPHDFNDSLLIAEKIKNVKTARIILDYWKKSINKEIREIEAEVEDANTTIGLKTTFRYNKRIVTAFIPELYGWVDKNLEFLEIMQEANGEFYVNYPFYQIPNWKMREKIVEAYGEREKAMKRVIKYSPFRAMIY